MTRAARYLAITPARDEQEFLPDMIDSMTRQTLLPQRWIVIDDGSEDRTPEILDEAARRFSWIEPKHLARGRKREPGGESVIMRYLTREVLRDVDYIVRFDSDLLFDSDYIERLLTEFQRDPGLGIVSGCLIEPTGGEWRLNEIPSFHTRGPSKIYSRACFEAIGGLEAGLGWDTIDEVKAMLLGFRTRNFRNINAFHRRTTGSARGLWRGRWGAGVAAYNVGYSQLFAIARASRFLFQSPPVLGSIMFLAGFYWGYWKRLPQVADRKVIEFIRAQQIRRLTLRSSVWQ
jgi:biofilm PGA synthesis N-glycosyltransferase PgaC